MARGIDIYRYQTVTDWNAVRNSGVEFVWVKLTDGFGPALVHGDKQVGGAKSVGIPVGGYHFAQKGDPARQARVFLGELDRLGAWGIVPALDIENTGVSWSGQEAHDFAVTFLRELRKRAPRVALYANTSELRAMHAAEIVTKVPGTVVWEANYGANNGQQNGLPVVPWARGVHQFTSVGRVPGIRENTDINRSYVDLRLEADDVSAQDVWNEEIQVRGQATKAKARDMVMENNFAAWEAVRLLNEQNAKIDLLTGKVDEGDAAILASVRQIPGADPAEVARLLAPLLGPLVDRGATPEQVREMCDAAIRDAFGRAAGVDQ